MRGVFGRWFSSKVLKVDDWDLLDFRLRALEFLRKKQQVFELKSLDSKEEARLKVLESEGKSEWSLSRHLDRVLGGAPHVEKDKQILRDLLAHCIDRNPKHRVQSMWSSLKFGDSQADCFNFLLDLGVIDEETNPCVLRHEQPLFFSPQVLSEVPKICALHESGHDPDKALRQDLRSLAVLAIDAPTATEIDDAVSVWDDSLGRQWIHVHVADPARLVAPRSLMDVYASRRGVSVFLPEKHFPMLPHSVSSTVFSIHPGKDTHVLTFAARLDSNGSIVEKQIFPSVVHNVAKISYKSADEVLEKTAKNAGVHLSPEHERVLSSLREWARKRRAFREGRGAIILDVPEPYVSVRGKKIVVSKGEVRSSLSRWLVEELMILAGQVAAEYAKEHQIPIPYRVQQPPNKSMASSTKQKSLSSSEYAGLVNLLVASEFHQAAFMDVIPRKHSSVGLDAYTQVTSPIRRYPDMMVAHQLKAALRKDALPFSSFDILSFRDVYEVTVRQVEQLQSSSLRYWILRFFQSDDFKAKVKENGGVIKALLLPRPAAALATASASSFHVVRNATEHFIAGELAPIFLLDYAFRGYVKLKRDHSVGQIVDVGIQRVDSLKLEIDFFEDSGPFVR